MPWRSTKIHNFKEKLEKFLDRPLEELYEIVDTGYITPCWLWKLATDSKGYGRIGIHLGVDARGKHLRRTISAPRAFFEKHYHCELAYLEPDHLCKVKLCVRPSHLEAVTRNVNMQRGPATKLTNEQVSQIIDLYTKGLTQNDLSKQFNVHQTQISRIVNHKAW